MTRFAGLVAQGAAASELAGLLSSSTARRAEPQLLVSEGALVFGVIADIPGGVCLARDGWWLVGDILLSDRATLCGRLGVDTGRADGELVLRAWQKWGECCVDYLSGDFGFAISDGHSVFCARDHLGVKPFCYAQTRGGIIFAAEAQPLARLAGCQINETRIADYLVFPLEHVDKVSTFYHDVYRLPPGSLLVFKDGRCAVRTFWQPDPDYAVRFASDREYTEAFRTLFVESVRDRINVGEPAASMLSGGVDSSTVVGYAAGMSQLTTYSTVEWQEPCEETRFIRMVADAADVDSVTISCEDFDGYLSRVLEQVSSVGEPFDHYMIQAMLVYLVAADRGHQFILDGLEGDMLHSLSLSYPSGLLRQGHVRQGLAEIYHVWRNGYGRQVPLWLFYLMRLRQIGLPESLAGLRTLKKRFSATAPRALGQSLIHADLAASTRTFERLEQHGMALYGGSHSLQQAHARNISHPAIGAATERYDRIAVRAGIEPRHPLVDLRLVNFSLGIPREQKVRYGFSKYHLRRIGRGVVPKQVSWRVGRDENAWRFIDRLTQMRGSRMREKIGDQRDLLAPYVLSSVLDRPRDEDLLELFGLVSWLERHNEW